MRNWFKNYWTYIILFIFFIGGVIGTIIWTINDSENIVGIVSIFVAFILALVALFQNIVFKKQNDKHQMEMEKYNKETNDRFLEIQSNIYNIQTQLLNVSNQRSQPYILAVANKAIYPHNLVGINYSGQCAIPINWENYYFKDVKNKFIYDFSVKNQGYYLIKDIKIKSVKIIRHWTNDDEIIEYTSDIIKNNDANILLNPGEFHTFKMPVPINTEIECPKVSVYITIIIKNDLDEYYNSTLYYLLERDERNWFHGEYKYTKYVIDNIATKIEEKVN